MGQALLVPAAVVIIAGGACLWAVSGAPVTDRTPVAWYLGIAAVLLCLAVTAAAYGMQQARHFRDRFAAMDAEIARLADDTLPALVKRLRDGASADTALAEIPKPADRNHQRILWTLAQEVGKGDRMRAAAMSACANAAGRVQALATSMLADLREMEDRHDEEVLGDLLKLDHSTAQAGRLADSIAVLTGARSGRRWTKPIVMESILRGAVGRISAYQRVRVHSASTAAIAGYAAEGVMHALAELMDNATSFSPPSEEVHVYVEEVSVGIVITIEDCGLIMSAAALSRAQKAVSSEPLDLTTLSGTRLGLAVVGCLARKHGLTVSFRPSSRGGTGVVVMIPPQLITQSARAPRPDEPRPAGVFTQRPARHAVAASEAAASETAVPEVAAPAVPAAAARPVAPVAPARAAAPAAGDELYELPKRRRGQTLAATSPTPSATPPAAPPTAKPTQHSSDPGARFRAFRQASRGSGTGSGASSPPEDDTR
ncbi:ATP-binding protein [Streptosporangium sp. NBC_01756]|uniref:ATP-binding protein n=1 Tax=Streptosporangium sp. NBC_01756 TaxID=2975950 RepID=UPI002DD81EEF|nr:ATP-binding protein [Streptosporangium sp. NBC_01756]WSC89533.1 ATP-binding protein [Streptosporangium sp. NBC_01756]